MSDNSQLACAYAVSLLQDASLAINEDNIATILKVAGVEVEPYWPGIFAKTLGNKDLNEVISDIGGGSQSGVAQEGGAGGEAAEAEPEAEEAEESSEEMGLGLFG